MSLTPSTMLALGTRAPDFTLADPAGQVFALADKKIDRGLLVIFMCNHCPYVKHIRPALIRKVREYQNRGITVVAINSNDAETYPADNAEKMAHDSKVFDYSFPYLVDDDQNVAKAYRAACTPDFFLFDDVLRLVYRGQFDGARPGSDISVTGADLTTAVEEMLAGEEISVVQRPSMGCNIKWKAGNEPDYFR